YAAGPIAAPGATGDLREQLERALRRTKVRQVEAGVGAQHADQRDAREVVALRDHLRADEDVDLAARDPRQHRRDAGGRELGDDRVGDLLGAEALALDRLARLALGADVGDALGVRAVVAGQA